MMEQGRIVAQGTFSEMMNNVAFSALMQSNDHPIGLDETDVEVRRKEWQTARRLEEESRPKATQQQAEPSKDVKIILAEERETGHVGLTIYRRYIDYCGGMKFFGFLAFMMVVCQVARVGSDQWLTVWINRQIPGWEEHWYEATYAAIGVFQVVVFVVTGILFSIAAEKASQNMHTAALDRVFAVCELTVF
jgi:hypothetical protein